MDFSLVYLFRRFLYRVQDFFHHWYVDGSREIAKSFMRTITSADQSLALAITLRHFFEPLYRDYSVIGRILGIVFRSFRVAIGAVVYLIITLIYAVVYFGWVAVPALLLFYAAKNI